MLSMLIPVLILVLNRRRPPRAKKPHVGAKKLK